MLKVEKFDPAAMVFLLKYDGISPEERKRLSMYSKKRFNGNCVEIKYDFTKSYKEEMYGRLIAEQKLGFQQFHHDIRNLLAKPHYFDVDMENAHPTILLKICKDNGWSSPMLERYVNQRNEIIKECSEQYGLSRSEVKNIMIRALYQGKHPLITETQAGEIKIFMDFFNEISTISRNVSFTYADIYKKVSARRITDREKQSTCLSYVLNTEEHKILMVVNNFMEQNGRKVGALIFDGCLVEKLAGESEMDQRLLIRTEQEIKSKLGYDIKLAVKPLESSIVVGKTQEELVQEAKQAELEEKYEKKGYEVIKEQFEKTCFKVMDPICFCEEDEEGKVIIRTQEKMKQAYGNKKCMTKTISKYGDEVYLDNQCFIDLWINDESIRTYRKMDMLPPPLECPPNTYNLWNGFATANPFHCSEKLCPFRKPRNSCTTIPQPLENLSQPR